MTFLISIIINNYNYGRFLRAAIESALAQEHLAESVEVIVVDDGSTDNSHEIIASYGSRIRPVLQSNGGQTAAINAGFSRKTADDVIFLDADDVLYPQAAAQALEALAQGDCVNVRWPMDVIDGGGRRTGATMPAHRLIDGDLRQTILENGPSSVPAAPTSGNAWSGEFLRRVLPAPTTGEYYRLGADEYLSNLAPLFGKIRTIPQPLSAYRVHGANRYSAKTFEQKLEFELAGHERQCAVLARFARELGHVPKVDQWRERSWFRRMQRTIDDIDRALPDGAPVVLIDDNTWGADEIASHRCVPFLERDGEYFGAAHDDETAIREIDRVRMHLAPYVALVWPSFWWIESFPRFYAHLKSSSRCLIENHCVLLFAPQEAGNA